MQSYTCGLCVNQFLCLNPEALHIFLDIKRVRVKCYAAMVLDHGGVKEYTKINLSNLPSNIHLKNWPDECYRREYIEQYAPPTPP